MGLSLSHLRFETVPLFYMKKHFFGGILESFLSENF